MEIVDKKSVEAIALYGGTATDEYYRKLALGRFESTRCRACGVTLFPPRDFCTVCHGEAMEWVPLPEEGTLFAFTEQDLALRFMRPDVLGLVEIAGVGRLLARIDAPRESLAIGQRVRFAALPITDAWRVPQFAPV